MVVDRAFAQSKCVRSPLTVAKPLVEIICNTEVEIGAERVAADVPPHLVGDVFPRFTVETFAVGGTSGGSRT